MNRAHFLQVRSGGFGYAFWSHATESKANPGPPEPTMRQERIIQASIFDVFAAHEMGRELRVMSDRLDQHREVLGLVIGDLRRRWLKQTGRDGLPAEAVLRCGLLKQHRQLSYEELAFHVQDSASFRAFARLPVGWCPKKSVLHKTISAVRAETWEQINRVLLAGAKEERIESGAVVRLDSTTSAALLHEPSDSSLLWDAVRVMVRLLRQADELSAGAAPAWRSHRRLAKKRALAIKYNDARTGERGRSLLFERAAERADSGSHAGDDVGGLSCCHAILGSGV